MRSSTRKFVLAAGLFAVGSTLAPGSLAAQADPVVPAVTGGAVMASADSDATDCTVTSSGVSGGTALFTVGPADCVGDVVVSFSTFELPGGMREPYADQILIAHADGNGSAYSAGMHQLTATLGDACNWQSDLYYGDSAMPVFGDKLIAYDYVENQDCTPQIEPCVLIDASVDGGTASFTVGPEDCQGEVGPLSFSAFELPGGTREPYDAQVLIAHHPDNGSMYPEGTYTLTLDLGDACNWQTDLYWGDSAVPVFGDKLVAYDFLEDQVCDDVTTTTTTVGGDTDVDSTVPTTTQAAGDGGQTTTTTATEEAAGAGPTTTQAVGGAGGSRSLPQTGPTETLMISLLGGLLLGLGAFARRMARS